jgi:hypothetical protein
LTQPSNSISGSSSRVEIVEIFMDDLDEMNDKLPLLMVDTANENLSDRNRR